MDNLYKADVDFDEELERDIRRYFAEDTMFLREEDDKPFMTDQDKEMLKSAAKEGVKKVGTEIGKKSKIVGKKALALVDKLKNNKLDEKELIKVPSRLDTLTRSAVGFTGCAALLGGPIAGLLGFWVSKFIGDGVTNQKRTDLAIKLNGEIQVIEAKLEEYNNKSDLTDAEKKDKYALIKMKANYEANLQKLRYNIKTTA